MSTLNSSSPSHSPSPKSLWLSSVLFLLVGLSACGPDSTAPLPFMGTSAQALLGPAFSDSFDAYDSSRWWKTDGYAIGGVFNVGWKASNTAFNGGEMTLTLNTDGCPGTCSGAPYASGAYQTLSRYGFGYYQVRMKAASGSGVVSSFFVYNEASHDEIDIEFLGKDTTKVQFNYVNNGVGGHETLISLGFDAAADFHTYAFSWDSGAIEWYVDGVLVHGEYGARGPLPNQGGKIFMNLWTGNGIDSWTGPLNYTGPVTATYDEMSWQAY